MKHAARNTVFGWDLTTSRRFADAESLLLKAHQALATRPGPVREEQRYAAGD